MSAAIAVTAALASAVIVLGGVAGGIRAIWKIAQSLRDNTRVTNATAKALEKLSATVDERFDDLVGRMAQLEGRRRRL